MQHSNLTHAASAFVIPDSSTSSAFVLRIDRAVVQARSSFCDPSPVSSRWNRTETLWRYMHMVWRLAATGVATPSDREHLLSRKKGRSSSVRWTGAAEGRIMTFTGCDGRPKRNVRRRGEPAFPIPEKPHPCPHLDFEPVLSRLRRMRPMAVTRCRAR